jgi:hypothetical protein
MANEGFNRQKNSDWKREHVYSSDAEKWKSYNLLLPIACSVVQVLERGRRRRRLAAELGRPFWRLLGRLKNVGRRLLDSVRWVPWQEAWFEARPAQKMHSGQDSS